MSDYFNTWYFLGLRPELFAKWILPRPSKVPGQMSRGQMRLCGHRWSTLSVSIGVQLYDGQPTPLVDTRPVKCDVISLSCRYLVETLSYSCTHIRQCYRRNWDGLSFRYKCFWFLYYFFTSEILVSQHSQKSDFNILTYLICSIFWKIPNF